ncbi:MAG: fatty acid desaturase [Gammaproteobacteria bacterium]|nr:fatty acid desaturase [Gammaproteobacteria bacterium]
MEKPKLIWLNVLVFSLTGLITLIGVPLYALTYGFDGWQIAAMIGGIIFCEISITAGYHRLWSHRAYEAHWLIRLIFAIGGTFATQNSILHWSSDHRAHHLHVDDNDRDPYSAKRGFWYSHMGWMLRDYEVHADPQYKNCRDLQKDPVVMWQHRYYLPLVLGINFGIPLLLGIRHGDIAGMLLLAGVARLAISHHMTFFINSLAHVWGSQPYSDRNTSRDNGLIALLTMGEGYHNYHHSFQRDYRNGIRWWQFDPTKWLIRSLAGLKLAKNLYRTPVEQIESSRARMLLTSTSRKLAQQPHADVLMLRLRTEYEILMNRINEFAQAKKQWMQARKASAMENYDLDALKEKAEQLKENFLQQKKQWLMLNAKLA